jgi:hypothetical protein
MVKLAPIELDNGSVIYIEVAEDVSALEIPTENLTRGEQKSDFSPKGIPSFCVPKEGSVGNFEVIQNTIRAYTTYVLNSFKDLAVANIDKVTLTFGIEIGGEAGIPYITKGTAKSNLNITVECSLSELTKRGLD